MAASRHRRPGARRTTGVAVLVGVVLVVASVVVVRTVTRARDSAQPAPVVPSAPATAVTPTATPPAPVPTPSATVPPADTAALAAIARITAGHPAGSWSVAALDTSTGASFRAGATGGMVEGSVAKLMILESLLLQRQPRAGTPTDGNLGLSPDEIEDSTDMIEHSDNDDADALFLTAGGRDELVRTNMPLGVTHTVLGPGIYKGLSTTDADDQIRMLQNLVTTTGPLVADSRAFVLGLMRSVESDQRWGVGVVADPGTDFANKNGWLAVDDDRDLWLTNSIGILTVHGHQVLMAVLTQHNADFDDGIAYVQALAKAIVPTVS